MERLEKIESGVICLAVGDALGVPVEFSSREERQRDPVAEMRGYGAHNQPADTWSDGTSMALCLMESLTRVELRGHHGQLRQMELGRVFTVGDICFDIGGTTLRAI